MKRRISLVVYILIIMLLVTACGAEAVATVNGEKITAPELKARLEQVAVMYGYDLESPDAKEFVGYLEEQVLENLIEERVVLQAAKTRNVTVSKEEIKAEMDKIRGQFTDDKSFADFLAERKFTEKDLDTYMKNQFILNKLFEEETKDILTTKTDIKKYYEENMSEFYTLEQIRASNIVVNTEEEAKAVIARLDKGENFGDLAVELSIDPTAKDNHGDIGYFDREAALVDEFKDAAFELKKGKYTQTPVQSQFGYHIILVEDRKAAASRSFEEVKAELENRFIFEDKNEKFSAYVDGLVEKAAIVKHIAENAPEKAPAAEGTAQPK
jgi:parvulin-like peptidyl-prolyl isomerase